MLLSLAVCLTSLTACASSPVVVPSDMVPVQILAAGASAPAAGAPVLRVGEALPMGYEGWWIISPGAMRRLYREARTEH
jgi:hypothetical protein